jgi:hypothetical protein
MGCEVESALSVLFFAEVDVVTLTWSVSVLGEIDAFVSSDVVEIEQSSGCWSVPSTCGVTFSSGCDLALSDGAGVSSPAIFTICPEVPEVVVKPVRDGDHVTEFPLSRE